MPARLNEVVLVDQGLISAYGADVGACALGLLEGRSVLRPVGDGFPPPLAAFPAGLVPEAERTASETRLAALVKRLFSGMKPVPPDAELYVATTVGDIGELEAALFFGTTPASDTWISQLPLKLADLLTLSAKPRQVISSACASSTAAVALAASAIRRGEAACALVVGCDRVSEFVLSGFASLMALDAGGARPFDAGRQGVSLGTAAAGALLMSRERAEREGRPILGYVNGWGLTCDANHLTGPSRDGLPLSDAIQEALAMAGVAPGEIAVICAHGTGTVYNDAMEMLAFRRVMDGSATPTFSVKGGMGHVLGAAGLAEALLALEFLRLGTIPPSVGLREPSEDARGWATREACPVSPDGIVLSTNSGFGGVNAALVLSRIPLGRAGSPARAVPDLRVAGKGACKAGALSGPAESLFQIPKNAERFSVKGRMAFRAASEALREAGIRMEEGRLAGPEEGRRPRIGVIVSDREGSAAANSAYFADYAGTGRVLGRGQLFVYTLPTTVAAECAIACRLTGPLLYVAQPDGGDGSARRAACSLLADGLADAFVFLNLSPEEAHAALLFPSEKGSS